ncbi:MAG: hypothetical protein ACJA0U_003083 [Salibacteraceae bacterium]|jgi:hypothetical protein
MKIFLIVLLSICSTLTSLAQDCNFDGKLDWTKVQVLEVESKDAPKGFVITGESTLKISKPIKSISDLNEHQLKKIKQMAAEWNSCAVYIDAKGTYDSVGLPTMASQNQLYYYWVVKE